MLGTAWVHDMTVQTIKLTVSEALSVALKRAMPKTNKAELALEKYTSVLESHLEQSLLHMDDNMYRFFKHFYVSTHKLTLEVGQFVIDGKRQYLHKWMEANNLNLVHVVRTGLKGADYSTVGLTQHVTMIDAMDINQLRKKTIDELDALLNDKTLTDADFFYKLFPDFLTMTQKQIGKEYDLCPVDVKSLKQFIVFLTKRANMMNDVKKQMLIRQARAIVRIAEAGNNTLPMKKNPSHFGRMYYTGRLNVQSMHKILRHAMLGDCYEYDIRSSVVAWKLGFAWYICDRNGITPEEFTKSFKICLAYLGDKKTFRETIRQKTFGNSTAISEDKQLDVVKQALTAISFGARKTTQGWIDKNGDKFNPAIVNIIADDTARLNFYACQEAAEYMEENKRMDAIITEYAKENDPALLNDTEFRTVKGRFSNSKLMSYLYQQSESIVMDIVRKEVKAVYKTILANVHDAIYINEKLHSADKKRIEMLMRRKTGLQFWYLDEEKISGYKGISDEVRKEELAHKLFMQQQEQLAKGHKSPFTQVLR
ncbi:hypothetical protein [Limnohabitans sp.]